MSPATDVSVAEPEMMMINVMGKVSEFSTMLMDLANALPATDVPSTAACYQLHLAADTAAQLELLVRSAHVALRGSISSE